MNIPNSEKFKSREERRREVACDGIERITISFYKYVTINDPQGMRDELFEALYEMGCLGRIYVAQEGINAQMNVPKSQWKQFDKYITSIPEFAGVPYKVAVEQADNSFYKLTVKVKEKIVADGLDDSLFDPSDTGEYLTAQEINDYIDDPEAVVIDMRNAYEAEIGHFENAKVMEVETFREQLQKVVQDFKEDKDKKIGLYCTGGIRCEKASAWMKHNGFTNVRHVRGGIIDYKHQVEEQGLKNRFLGTNFVFDERLGERIGDEIISYCHLCRTTKSDQYTHCRYKPCHVLFIGCDDCRERKRGFCSYRCMLLNQLPARVNKRLARIFAIRPQHAHFRKNRLHHSH